MGYRSDVKVLINLPERDIIKEAELIKVFGLFDEVKVNEAKDLILCSAESIKYYDDFEEVVNFENWLQDTEESFYNGETGGIHFVRIGEDLEDTEERVIGEVSYWLDLIRTIGNGDF